MSCPDQETVVLVDDDRAVLQAVARILRALDVHVLATEHAYEALDWLATREVAVIVSDFEMPGMNGIELLSTARRQQESTVRVLMTGVRELDTAIDAINRGELFRYVQKPFHSAELRTIVGDALARHRELAMVAADRDQAVRRARCYAELEAAWPGIRTMTRDDVGCYVVPDVCNSDAMRRLGLT